MAKKKGALAHMMTLNAWLGDPRAIRKELLERRPDGTYRLAPTARALVDERLAASGQGVLTPDADPYGADVRAALAFFGVPVPEHPGTGGVGTPSLPGGVDPAGVKPLPGGRRGRRG